MIIREGSIEGLPIWAVWTVLYALKDCTNKSSIMLLALPLFFQIMLKIMLVFEKYATLLVEEGLQVGDKIIHDYAFCSN